MPDAARRTWTGSMPEVYDRDLGPAVFAPFARDLAHRISRLAPTRILELAAGTGLLTREITRSSPQAQVIATDLNHAMVDYGAQQAPGATWQQANAQDLPFPDMAFDLAACQFGVMFFPDRTAAFRAVHRVLTPGGHLVFNTWDTIDTHDFAAALTDCFREIFPADPPSFLTDVPHGYADTAQIRADLTAGGLECQSLDTITLHGTAHAADVARGFCTGTPNRAEIEARADLAATTALLETRMRTRLGDGPVRGSMTAHVIVARRPD